MRHQNLVKISKTFGIYAVDMFSTFVFGWMLACETVASSKSMSDEQLLGSKLIESVLSFRTTFWLVFILQLHASNALSIRFSGSGFVHKIALSFLFCSSVLIEVLCYCSRDASLCSTLQPLAFLFTGDWPDRLALQNLHGTSWNHISWARC